jgi:hypothetical protein
LGRGDLRDNRANRRGVSEVGNDDCNFFSQCFNGFFGAEL